MDRAIRARLEALAEPAYGAFMGRLLPEVPPEQILGVRLLQLRKLARTLAQTPAAEAFLRDLPHGTLEENHLHSFLLDRQCRTYEQALAETERFLPYVDNWAVCDSFRPGALRQNLPDLEEQIRRWLRGPAPYTVRFALVLLLNWYLTDHFRPAHLAWVSQVYSEEYYVNMAAAWYWSMALVRQPAAALPLFEAGGLDPWIHNKAIQKAVESRQTTEAQKLVLRGLRR